MSVRRVSPQAHGQALPLPFRVVPQPRDEGHGVQVGDDAERGHAARR